MKQDQVNADKKPSKFNIYVGPQPMQSRIKHAGNGLDTFTEQNIQEKIKKTFISNRASEAIGFCCHPVKNSLPYSTDCTKVGILCSSINLGATPMCGDINLKLQKTSASNEIDYMVCKDIIGYSDVYLEQDEYRRYGDMSPKLVESKNRTTFNMNQGESSVIYELAQIKNTSNFVSENGIEILNHGSVDSLVYYTNNSAVCLIKYPALGCQVSASYTARNMVASLDTSFFLDSSSPTNLET